MTAAAPGRRRGRYWFAVALSLVAVILGSGYAYVRYQETAGPDGAVKGYFAALARSNAPAALGFGDLPSGSTALLTSTVLRDQQKIAPIRDFHVVSTDRHGSNATVDVRYRLEFGNGTQQITDQVAVVQRGGSWRLATTAVRTRLRLLQAAGRATVVGARVPTQSVLLFPGAVPIRFDTPYLELSPATSSVRLSGEAVTALDVDVATAGKVAMNSAVAVALKSCVAGSHGVDLRCPLPDARAVPGTMRATLTGRIDQRTKLSVAADPQGVIAVSGTVQARGSYTALDFNNQRIPKRGALTLPMRATAPAVAPLVVRWQDGL
jgi:hypothetical protein